MLNYIIVEVSTFLCFKNGGKVEGMFFKCVLLLSELYYLYIKIKLELKYYYTNTQKRSFLKNMYISYVEMNENK